MISKRIISEIRALHLDKNRKEQQLFIAEGEKVVDELLNSGLKVKLIAGTEKYSDTHDSENQVDERYLVSDEELLKISLLQSPNKVLAVGEMPTPSAINFSGESGLLLALDGIKDPGNLGTLIRTADWFGVRHLFCSADCVDAYNPKVVQSAMGSLFRMQIHYGDLNMFIAEAKSSGGYKVIGAGADGIPYSDCDSSGNIMLVIGSESHGIGQSTLSLLDVKAGIPKNNNSKAESLNAGVAAAILMAHFQSGTK